MVEERAAEGATACWEDAEQIERALVARVRAGEERAFEAIYLRHRSRVLSLVLGMVGDHARAEDITQEVFISALRRLRATEGPVILRPWLQEIARNACIDAHRRSHRRVHEVSLDLDAPLHAGAMRHSPAAEEQLATRQIMADLRHAFAGLPASQHELLVMRELDGLSYREIGERTGLSRAAVESVLFRARRRLLQEYEGVSSGEHCRRVHRIILAAVAGPVGVRERLRMARHVRHCSPCRRQARHAGVDPRLLRAPAPVAAALLPLPGLLGRLTFHVHRRTVSLTAASSARVPSPRGLGALLTAGLAASAVGLATVPSGAPAHHARTRRAPAPVTVTTAVSSRAAGPSVARPAPARHARPPRPRSLAQVPSSPPSRGPAPAAPATPAGSGSVPPVGPGSSPPRPPAGTSAASAVPAALAPVSGATGAATGAVDRAPAAVGQTLGSLAARAGVASPAVSSVGTGTVAGHAPPAG